MKQKSYQLFWMRTFSPSRSFGCFSVLDESVECRLGEHCATVYARAIPLHLIQEDNLCHTLFVSAQVILLSSHLFLSTHRHRDHEVTQILLHDQVVCCMIDHNDVARLREVSCWLRSCMRGWRLSAWRIRQVGGDWWR